MQGDCVLNIHHKTKKYMYSFEFFYFVIITSNKLGTNLPRESVLGSDLPHQPLYNSRLKTWMDWCLQREMDPIDPTVTSMADFLIFLFEEKKFLPSSIKVYRSAIASTLKHFTSVDFHPIKSFLMSSGVWIWRNLLLAGLFPIGIFPWFSTA